MNEIQQWIDNPERDYADGVELFARHCKNKALVRHFRNGTARFRMGKLVYEMGKVAKTVAVESATQSSVETRHGTSPQTDVSGLSDLDLSKRRSALRFQITKTRNMLDFQTIRKGDSLTPMPPGPKREEYEQKLKALKSEYNAIIKELERRSQ